MAGKFSGTNTTYIFFCLFFYLIIHTIKNKDAKIDSTEPSENLELQYVNGYRCEDSRNNM